MFQRIKVAKLRIKFPKGANTAKMSNFTLILKDISNCLSIDCKKHLVGNFFQNRLVFSLGPHEGTIEISARRQAIGSLNTQRQQCREFKNQIER